MTDQGPVYLRWRTGRLMPAEERFDTLDAALDVVDARWATLRQLSPQILDARRVLLLSTTELVAMSDEEAAGAD